MSIEKDLEVICLDSSDEDTNDTNKQQLEVKEENAEQNSDVEKLPTNLSHLRKDNSKFLENFDPELSNREKRKLSRKIQGDQGGKRSNTLYDERGFLICVEKDLCDCLSEKCPGCHFPCLKCRSCKCGIDCRVNRRWTYEVIENKQARTMTRNPFIHLIPGQGGK